MAGWHDPANDYDYPYDEPEPEQEPDYADCEMGIHADWDEVDMLTGRVQCRICGEVFSLTDEQMKREERRQREYDRYMRRQLWRDRWRAFTDAVCFWRRWRKPADVDDDCPF